MGRKSLYTDELAKEICKWIADGKTLADFCRQAGKPSYRTVKDWVQENEEFSALYARARDIGHDVIAEECLEISDEKPPVDSNGRIDPGYVAWQKNKIWTRTQLLAKWNPKKYGDAKRELEVSGPNGGPIQTAVIDPSTMNPDARDALRYALTAAARASQSDDKPFEDDDEDSE